MRRFLASVAIRSLRFVLRSLGKTRGATAAAELSQGLAPVIPIPTPRGPILMLCPSRTTVWRAHTFMTKEPDTLEWIDGFEPGSVLWDVGANVGVYTLYAALGPGAQVVAFEPAAPNYYLLNANIRLNRLDGRVRSVCLALDDGSVLGSLDMGSTEPGAALHSFTSGSGGPSGASAPAFRQGMLGLSVDDFVARFDPPFPNHLKLDVDGNENRIIRGARRTLADPRLRSVLVEIDVRGEGYRAEVTRALEDAGLRLLSAPIASPISYGEGTFSRNHIFVRD